MKQEKGSEVVTRHDPESKLKQPDSTEIQEPRIDRWVRDHPVWSFSFVAILAAALFFLLYWMTGTLRIGGYQLDEKITGYVGSIAATMVAFAGALVSVVLARLALKLGREAKEAAERGNAIQEQMQRFADPAFVEAREGHKAAGELDLLGTLLSVYAAEVFVAPASERPIAPIRDTYKRGNDLVSNAALYRYCAQLIGPSEATIHFAATQAKIYEAARMLGPNGEPGRNDVITTARNAEQIAVDISGLSRMLERAKKAALVDQEHHLHAIAQELKWSRPENQISGCESTARAHFLESMIGTGVKSLTVVRSDTHKQTRQISEHVAIEDLRAPGARSVVHVLETDLQDLLVALGDPRDAKEYSATTSEPLLHKSLRDFAHADEVGGKTSEVTDIIIASWRSSLDDSREALYVESQKSRMEFLPDEETGPGSAGLWSKAKFLAKNPSFDRVTTLAMQDAQFLRQMTVTEMSDNYHNQGNDPTDVSDELWEKERRIASRSARRLCYIHAAIEDLRRTHREQGAVVVPDSDPYAALTQEDGERAIIVIRPCFAKIDMSVAGSEWDVQNKWFQDLLANFSQYCWEEHNA